MNSKIKVKDSFVFNLQKAVSVAALLLAGGTYYCFNTVGESSATYLVSLIPFILNVFYSFFGRGLNINARIQNVLLMFFATITLSVNTDYKFFLPANCIARFINKGDVSDFSFCFAVILVVIIVMFTYCLTPKSNSALYFAYFLASLVLAIVASFNLTQMTRINIVLAIVSLALFNFCMIVNTKRFEYDESLFVEFYEDEKTDEKKSRFDNIVDEITNNSSDKAIAKKASNWYYSFKKYRFDKLQNLDTDFEEIKSYFKFWLDYACENFKYTTSNCKNDASFVAYCALISLEDDTDTKAFYDISVFFDMASGVYKYGDKINIDSHPNKSLNTLSNFSEHSFTFEGIQVNSMESFLQGLKFKSIKKQRRVFLLSGKEAKKVGKHHNFYRLSDNLYFNGKKIDRYSKEYKSLVISACIALYNSSNDDFKAALDKTFYSKITCDTGKKSKLFTVLTKEEFEYCLSFLRYLNCAKKLEKSQNA